MLILIYCWIYHQVKKSIQGYTDLKIPDVSVVYFSLAQTEAVPYICLLHLMVDWTCFSFAKLPQQQQGWQILMPVIAHLTPSFLPVCTLRGIEMKTVTT